MNMRLIHTTERPLNTVIDLYLGNSLQNILDDLQLKQSSLSTTDDLRQRMEIFSQISFSFSAPIVRNLVNRLEIDNQGAQFSELQRPLQNYQTKYGKSKECCDYKLTVTTANNKVHFIYFNRLFLINCKTVFHEKVIFEDEISNVLTTGNQTLVRCFAALVLPRQNQQNEVFVFGTTSYVNANQSIDQRNLEVQIVCKQALHFVYSDNTHKSVTSSNEGQNNNPTGLFSTVKSFLYKGLTQVQPQQKPHQ